MKNREKGTRLTELVLCHVRYIVHNTDADGSTMKDEIALPVEGAAKAFKFVFSRHGFQAKLGIKESRTLWLEERVIWEHVDGQHVVAACKNAKEMLANQQMTRYTFENVFRQRPTTFVVYDNPRMYITKSWLVNDAVHHDSFLSTMSDNLKKLWQI